MRFLYGAVTREVGIRLPPEFKAGAGKVGLLNKSLYGLRDAPQIWQDHISGTLKQAGFEECPTTVGIYRHRTKQIALAVHVDDVLATGSADDLNWLRDTLLKCYKVKSLLIGEGHAKTGYFLKRKIQWGPDGISWEADQRHAQSLIAEWGITRFARHALPVSSDASKPPTGNELVGPAAKAFRSGAARVQYLSHDRADLGPAACILAQRMSAPRQSDEMLLRRVADYLKTCPNLPLVFKWASDAPHEIQAFTDSDWATCECTRRSRSGGVLKYRGHTVAHFCRTQDAIALSSAEAELKASCKGISEALGILELVQFLFPSVCYLIHLTDASANQGILKRKGAGSLKHLSVKQLWCQDIFRRPGASCQKVARAFNPIGRNVLRSL